MSGQSSFEYVALLTAVVVGLAAAGLAARTLVVGELSARAQVERLVAGPLAEFLAARSSPARDARLDWSTDRCSAPLVGSTGRSFDFTDACVRHDFAYRNLGALGLLRERRLAVDRRFRADMLASCAARARLVAVCRRWARIFYAAVRRFGEPREATAYAPAGSA